MNKYMRIIFCAITCVTFISCVSGTALTEKWGKISPDTDVKKYFETYYVNPDMNYYISGSDVYPNAIIGLNKAYTLDSTLWKKVELTEAKLQELVTYMRSRAMNFGQGQFGFAILDDQGTRIGVWYSILSATTAVHMKGDNKVMIYTPDNDTYEKYEENSSRPMR